MGRHETCPNVTRESRRGGGRKRSRRRPLLLAATLGTAIILVLAGSGLALAFTDTVDNPYATAIDELAARHIINGFPGDVFKPNDPVIRQQFAKMIVLTLGYEVPATATCPFTDVDATPNPNDPPLSGQVCGGVRRRAHNCREDPIDVCSLRQHQPGAADHYGGPVR